MKQHNMRAQAFIIAAAILWGTTGSAQAFAPEGASPIAIGALRMAIGGSALFLIAVLRGSFKSVRNINKKLLFLASLCMALYQPLFFSGVQKTGVALGTVLALGSAPIFSGIMEYVTEKVVNKKWILATTISIVGCVFLFGFQDSVNMNFIGAFLSLGAGLSYAVYVKVSRNLFENHKNDVINGLVFLMSAVILLPILFLCDISWAMSARGFFVILHLGLIATALSYTLFAYGLTSVSTPKAVTLTLFEPLTATMLGVIVFHERLSFGSTIGVILLFCGLIINTLSEKNK